MMPLLRVEGLSVGIRRNREYLPAVESISFTIMPGEIVGIVGESGCGKSLTALSIPGLLPQGVELSGGSVIFDGRDIGGLSEGELCRIRGSEISLVFQEPMSSLNPLIKIGPQIAEPLKLHGWKDRKLIAWEVADIMNKVGLRNPEKLIHEYPHQLSGGMRQRVMIALAMVCKPKLLIADEPTTALDVTIQAQILGLMKGINRELGTSILFISHDLGVINRICDRVLVMYSGRIVEEGTVRNIFLHPLHEYTRGLMGSIPLRERKGEALVNIPGKVPSIEEKGQAHFAGCPFAPRCARAEGRCFAAFPEVLPLGENHSVRCVLVNPESEMEYVRI
jgi:peptide/nickel transport system ATP-binding protein